MKKKEIMPAKLARLGINPAKASDQDANSEKVKKSEYFNVQE